jgi:hypothetical protein
LSRAIDAPSSGGDKAKILSALFRRIVQAARRSSSLFSQLRDNIGALPFQKKSALFPRRCALRRWKTTPYRR